MKRIVFLHHSTGQTVWLGNTNKYIYKITRKGDVQKFFSKYNSANNTNHKIVDLNFPKAAPYGWKNYPFDYYNIWVKNAGPEPYMEEPTLEMLTMEYDVIIIKHCFPVGLILEDLEDADVNSNEKRVGNYKLQYHALKQKMHEFPNNKFILWTPPALLKSNTTEEQAKRTHDFYKWIVEEWDEEGDNIYLWDFYRYETEGGIYLKEAYAAGTANSHPNASFAAKLSPLFAQFIIDCLNDLYEY